MWWICQGLNNPRSFSQLASSLPPLSLPRASAGRGRPHPLGPTSATRHHPFYTHALEGNSPGRWHPGLLRADTHRDLQDSRPKLTPLRSFSASGRGFAAAELSLRRCHSPPCPGNPAPELSSARPPACKGERQGGRAPLLRYAPGRSSLGGGNPRSWSRRLLSFSGTLLTLCHTRRAPGSGALQEHGLRALWETEAWLWPRLWRWQVARGSPPGSVRTPWLQPALLGGGERTPAVGRLGEGISKLSPFSAQHSKFKMLR